MTRQTEEDRQMAEFLLTTKVRRFHMIPASKLSRQKQQFAPSITTMPFDREAVLANLKKAWEGIGVPRQGTYVRVQSAAHQLYSNQVVAHPDELRMLLRFLTHPKIFETEREDSSWIEQEISEEALTSTEAFALTERLLRRLEPEVAGSFNVNIKINELLMYPVRVLARLFPVDEVMAFALSDPLASALVRQKAFENCLLSPPGEQETKRIGAHIADTIERHIEDNIPTRFWLSLLETYPSQDGLALVLEQFSKLESILHHADQYVRLIRLIEDREVFDQFVYKSEALVHFQPATVYAQIARWGLDDCDEMLAQIRKKLGCAWSIDHWGLIFQLHMPEVTPLVLKVLYLTHTMRGTTYGKALRWMRQEGANAMGTLVEHLLDDKSKQQDLAREILIFYANRGYEDLLRAHLEGANANHDIFEQIEKQPRPTLKLQRRLTYEELPQWLQYWTKRGLTPPYPPTLPKTILEPLETAQGAYLGRKEMIGVLRLLQEASKHHRPEIESLRAYFTKESRSLLALCLQGIWSCQSSPGKYRWMVAASALLEEDSTIGMLRSEMHRRPNTAYYYPQQPSWVRRALSCHPNEQGLRLLLEDWMWRRQQRSRVAWKDPSLARAANERGQSYFGMLEKLLPELGIARNGKCHFEHDGLVFCYELDETEDVLLSQHRDGEWREVSRYHPNSVHARARKRAEDEATRLLSVYTPLLLDAMKEGTEWRRFEWMQGLNHPVIRSRRQRVLWAIEDERGNHLMFLRVCEDGSLANEEDEFACLPRDCRIKPARWDRLSPEALLTWSTLFAEHEVVALGR